MTTEHSVFSDRVTIQVCVFFIAENGTMNDDRSRWFLFRCGILNFLAHFYTVDMMLTLTLAAIVFADATKDVISAVNGFGKYVELFAFASTSQWTGIPATKVNAGIEPPDEWKVRVMF